MNERADALATQGRQGGDQRWPGPRKLEPLLLCVRDHVKAAISPFPGNLVSDRKLIRCAADGLSLLEARGKPTGFTRDMLSDPLGCSVILREIHYHPDSLVRLWMQTVSGLYPTTARLHRMFPAKYLSPVCPNCNMGVPETLCHFLTVCPRFRAARTEAHNRCWLAIMQRLQRLAPPGWQFHVDKPLANTGLRITLPSLPAERRSEASTAIQAGTRGPDLANLAQWRPDSIAIHRAWKKIAILEHSRPFDGEDAPLDAGEPSADDSNPAAELSQMDSHTPADQISSPPLPSGTPRPSLGTRVERPSCRRLAVAAERKRMKYQPVVDALHAQYGSRGWSIEVLPWVVGTRGTLDTHEIGRAHV